MLLIQYKLPLHRCDLIQGIDFLNIRGFRKKNENLKWQIGRDIIQLATNRVGFRLGFRHCTLYYAEVFPLHRFRLRFLGTVPILGKDLHPNDRSLSQVHTFQSGDQSPNPNQWKSLYSTRIHVSIWVRFWIRQCK